MGYSRVKFPQFWWKLNIKKRSIYKDAYFGKEMISAQGMWLLAAKGLRSPERERDTDGCSLNFCYNPKVEEIGLAKTHRSLPRNIQVYVREIIPCEFCCLYSHGQKKKIGSVQVSLSLFCRIWMMYL